MTIRRRVTRIAHVVFKERGFVAGFIRWLLVVLFAVLMLSWRDPSLRHLPGFGLWWRNALPMALLALVITGLSGRILLSAWLSGTAIWIVFQANSIKEHQMNMPLMPGDWVLRNQLLHNLNFFRHYTGSLVIQLVSVLLFVAVVYAIWRIERHWPRPHWSARIMATLVPLVVLFMLFRGDRPWGNAYAEQNLPGYASWEPVESVSNVGLMAALIRMTQDARIRIPMMSQHALAKFAATHAQSLQTRFDRKAPAQLPDIVVVQSEAFFDPEILKSIGPGEFAPNFDRLAATGISGPLVTPAYGGGTIRTEFETLTGYPMLAFPAIPYPYYGLAAGWMPSMPRRLRQFGYSTTLFHPFESSFWNRQQTMPELGFEREYYLPDFAHAAHSGIFVSDRALFDFVLSHIDHEGPSYSMVITMENHGPWNSDPVGVEHMLDGHPLPAGLSPAGRLQFAYYAAHLVNGDAALGDFVQRLMARPRWTVLVFYGDHLPGLDSAFTDLGFDDGKTYIGEHTKYMLLSNRPLQPRQLELSAFQLPGLLFDTIGLPMDGYMDFDAAIRQAQAQAPASQRAHFDQLSFNAAEEEVRCQRKLKISGKCRKPVF